MDSVIFNPLEEYEKKLKDIHLGHTNAMLEEFVQKSGINAEENRATVEQYNIYNENVRLLKKKYNQLRFWRVIMCITIVLIPVVIKKTTPKIRELREDIEQAGTKANELLSQAYEQTAPLTGLFTSGNSLELIQKTVPTLTFDSEFSAEKEEHMRVNYDLAYDNDEETTLDVLSGEYNGNPFLFENKVVHRMGTETYYGEKVISWTETYRDSDGKMRTRTRTQTLRASVQKPKPFYGTQVVLNYGAQAARQLCFSRDATHLDQKSDKAIEKYIKRGEKRLDRMSDRAVKNNEDFTSMSNTEFEVLFDALDRTDEVQFRTLFTPLAQTNMVDLIRSKTGYGDDFNFFKRKRMNKILSNHSQGRAMAVAPGEYKSYDFEVVKQNFISKNVEFFRSVYFDFAPILAIPAYQDRPVQSLQAIPKMPQICSLRECEALANAAGYREFAHPDTKTTAILKTNHLRSSDKADEFCIKAYSYDIESRVDVVTVRGDDGRYHDVNVYWDEYLPLENQSNLFVAKQETRQGADVMAARNGVCIFR